MAKSKSWSVKGIAPETRDTARDAAQAAGLPIGTWIDNAIVKAARGELPGVPGTGRTAGPATGTTGVPEDTDAGIAAGDAETIPPGGAAVAAPTDDAPSAAAEDAGTASVDAGPDSSPGRPPELVAVRGDRADAGPPHPAGRPRRRAGVLRYAAVAIAFAALLAGAGWYLLEFSGPTLVPDAPAVATAEPPADAAPAEPAPSAPDAAPPESPAPDAAPAPAAPARPGGTDTASPANRIQEITAAANAGDARAQHDLAMLHLSGRMGRKDAAEAARWFEKAAVQGLANAQFNLGVLYQNGEGVAENQSLAFFWYQSAAEQGFPRAEHNLATAYAEGRGVPRNNAKAVEWFTKAANAGLAISQYSLGVIHERGFGEIAPDLEAARSWYASAAAQGDKRSQERLTDVDRKLAARAPGTAPARPAPAPAAEATPPPANDRPLNRGEVREMQRLLNVLNFDAGPPDGQMGPRTRSAIELYQRFAGLPVDGKPTQTLLDDLRAVAQTMSKDG